MPKKWQLCILLLAATTLNYLDRQTLSILAPVLQKELHIGNEALGWLFAAFYYVYTFALFAAGPILDRSHLRWAFAGAVLLWSLVSVLTGLANGFAALLVFRLALGLVEAANWPAATRVVARILEPRERALGNGVYTSGTSVAALIAPGLILGIAGMFGWRMAFVLIGSLGAVWICGWIFMTRDRDLAPVWREPAMPLSNAPGTQRKIFADILGSPRFLPVLVIAVLVNPCLYFSVNWLPTYFAQQRGLSPGRQMGWILTAIYLGLDIGNLACGAGILALTRRGRSVQQARRIVFLLATATVVCCAAVPVLPMSGAVVALVLVNFGLGIWVAIYLTMTQEVSSTHPSTALGVLSGCGSLAGALAMWAVGRVTQQTASFTIPMSTVALAAAVSAIAGWMASTELESAPLEPVRRVNA
jgi:MFS transporter, ACS family, aldohexuronate transporter